MDKILVQLQAKWLTSKWTKVNEEVLNLVDSCWLINKLLFFNETATKILKRLNETKYSSVDLVNFEVDSFWKILLCLFVNTFPNENKSNFYCFNHDVTIFIYFCFCKLFIPSEAAVYMCSTEHMFRKISQRSWKTPEAVVWRCSGKKLSLKIL